MQERYHPEGGILRQLFERMDDGFFIGELIRDDSGRAQDFHFLDYNQTFARQIGLPSPPLGLRASEAIPTLPRDVIGSCSQALELSVPVTREIQLPALGDGWYVLRIYPVMGHRFMVLFVDISQGKRTEQRLKESEALLTDVVETMDQLVWTTGPDGRHERFNRRWYEFTGKPPGSGSSEVWLELCHPDDRDRKLAEWHHSLETGQPYEMEYRLRHHSKGWRWVLERAHPVRDEQGSILRWMGTCTDIQHQKELAQDLELATEELNHRIKNIFAIVSALITLSLREHREAKVYGQELLERMEALGRAHHYARPLGKGSPASRPATVLGLIRHLLQPYEMEGREKVVVEGDDGLLDHHASTSLSLAMHELATNAAKYGALSTTAGQVRVVGKRHGDMYDIRWEEHGGPQVVKPERFGFGSRLLQVSLQNRLEGKLTREWLPDGLVVHISAAAKNIIRDD